MSASKSLGTSTVRPIARAEDGAAPASSDGSASSTPRAYLSVKAMCERLDVSESTFHRIRDEDWMPRPIALSSKVVRWSAAEVDEALRRRAPRVEVGANMVPENLAPASRKYRSGVGAT